MDLGGMCNPQPWYPTLRQNICIVLIEIAFGTVCDSSLQCGCFGLLMIRVAHSEGGKSSRTWVSICAMTFSGTTDHALRLDPYMRRSCY